MAAQQLPGSVGGSVGTSGGGVVQPTTPGRTLTPRERATLDSVRRAIAAKDSAARDSARKKLVNWVEPDSVTQALLLREGYGVTKYQGGHAVYQSDQHQLTLTGPRKGERAAVNQDQTMVVGDTIVYQDSERVVRAHGDTVTVRDPTRNEDDIVSIGRVVYDVKTHEAITTAVPPTSSTVPMGRVAMNQNMARERTRRGREGGPLRARPAGALAKGGAVAYAPRRP